jgi:prepilin-type N-terminal cleavage/methylation domain-containing protein
MKRGFTLLELIIVIIIIGVLATLGFASYGRLVEGSRGAEARDVIGAMRKMAYAYYLKNGDDLTGVADDDLSLGAGIPNACAATHYFAYSFTPPVGTSDIVFHADRCGPGAGGKTPDGPAAVADAVVLTTNYVTGQDDWSRVAHY